MGTHQKFLTPTAKLRRLPVWAVTKVTSQHKQGASLAREQAVAPEQIQWRQRRLYTPELIEQLADSLKTVGQLAPVLVRLAGRDSASHYVGIDGGLRCEAAIMSKQPSVIVRVIEGDEIDLRLVQIASNLDRQELTALERADLLVERARLLAAKGVGFAHPGGDQPHDRGISRGARLTGSSRDSFRRAEVIASLSEEARKLLSPAQKRNASFLLKFAKRGSISAKQVSAITASAERGRPQREVAAKTLDTARNQSGSFPEFPDFLRRNVDDDLLVREWSASHLRALLLVASNEQRLRFVEETLLPEVLPAKQVVGQSAATEAAT
jgi:hypothetical protein